MVCPELRRKVFQNRVEIDQFRSQLLLQAAQLRPHDPNLPTYALDLQLYEAAVTSVNNAVANFEASIWQSIPEVYEAHLALKEEERAAAAGFTAPPPNPPKSGLLSDHSCNSSAPDACLLRDLDPTQVHTPQKASGCLVDQVFEPVTPQGKENAPGAGTVSSPPAHPPTPEPPAPASPQLSGATSASSAELTNCTATTSSDPSTPPSPPPSQQTPPPTSSPPASDPTPSTPPQQKLPSDPMVMTPPQAQPIPTNVISPTPSVQSPTLQQAAAALSMEPSALQAWLQSFDSITRALPALNSAPGVAALQQTLQQQEGHQQAASPPTASYPTPTAVSCLPGQPGNQAVAPSSSEVSFSSTATQLSYAPSSIATHSYSLGNNLARTSAPHFTPLGGIAEHAVTHHAVTNRALSNHSMTGIQSAQPGGSSMLQSPGQLAMQQMQQTQASQQVQGSNPGGYMGYNAGYNAGYNQPASPMQYTPPSPSITSSMITNHPVPSTTSDSPLARLIAEAAGITGMAGTPAASFTQAVHQSVNTDKDKVDQSGNSKATKGEQLYKQLDAQTLCELAQLMLCVNEAESVSSLPSGLTSHSSRVPSSTSAVANSTVAKHQASYPASSTSTSVSGDRSSTVNSSGTSDSKDRKKKKQSKFTRAYKSAMKETFSNDRASDNSRLWMNWA